MKRTAGILGMALVAATVAGCASTPEPADVDVEEDAQPEAAAAERTIWDGVFTAEQASRGERIAQAECFICHSENEWSSSTFLGVWSGRSIQPLYDNIRLTMPYDAPGRLSRQEYADIVAYILELNGAETGNTELPSDDGGLSSIVITGSE